MKRLRTADELMKFTDGSLEDEEYLMELTRALYELSLKEFYKNREEEEMICHFRKKVPEHKKDGCNDDFLKMSFGDALLAAEEAGEIKGDCLVSFFMLLKGPEE